MKDIEELNMKNDHLASTIENMKKKNDSNSNDQNVWQEIMEVESDKGSIDKSKIESAFERIIDSDNKGVNTKLNISREQKRITIGRETSNKRKNKILILCDQHKLNLQSILNHKLSEHETQMISKPSALFEQVIENLVSLSNEYTMNDHNTSRIK
ncbi:hypothetical protein JTB14_019268 [Gonioctena quinquepunctata]|nr:hypothetical protein JTB14_019268 [Gonioctena quinquepunctata]